MYLSYGLSWKKSYWGEGEIKYLCLIFHLQKMCIRGYGYILGYTSTVNNHV